MATHPEQLLRYLRRLGSWPASDPATDADLLALAKFLKTIPAVHHEVPGPTALLAPGWLRWEERIRPGDRGPGDLLAPTHDDPRLVPGYTATGDPAIPVHVIGGIADAMAADETLAFVQAARTEHVFGASLYEFPRTSAFEWRALAPLR